MFNRKNLQRTHSKAAFTPSSLMRQAVYERMREELSMVSSFVSLPLMYNLLKKFYPHVSIPSESMLAKCDTCSILKAEKSKIADAEREAFQSPLDKHLELQSQERQYYYKHRHLAQRRLSFYHNIWNGAK